MRRVEPLCVCGHCEDDHIYNQTGHRCTGPSHRWMCKCEGGFLHLPETECLAPDQHPEDICGDCGGPNVTWFAPNDLWNRVARKPDGSDPMLCPTCFIVRAEAAGISGSAWMVVPESTTLNQLITVSGQSPGISACSEAPTDD